MIIQEMCNIKLSSKLTLVHIECKNLWQVLHLIVSDTKSLVPVLHFELAAIFFDKCCMEHVFNTYNVNKLMCKQLVSILRNTRHMLFEISY